VLCHRDRAADFDRSARGRQQTNYLLGNELAASNQRGSTWCGIHAAVVDAAILSQLHDLVVEFHGILAHVRENNMQARSRREAEVDRATVERDRLSEGLGRLASGCGVCGIREPPIRPGASQ
jgi:hypothetical protein